MSKRIPEQEYLKKRSLNNGLKKGEYYYLKSLPYYCEDKQRWIKPKHNRKNKVWIKKYCNRKIRRYKGDFGNELGQFKKISEFWWELY